MENPETLAILDM